MEHQHQNIVITLITIIIMVIYLTLFFANRELTLMHKIKTARDQFSSINLYPINKNEIINKSCKTISSQFKGERVELNKINF